MKYYDTIYYVLYCEWQAVQFQGDSLLAKVKYFDKRLPPGSLVYRWFPNCGGPMKTVRNRRHFRYCQNQQINGISMDYSEIGKCMKIEFLFSEESSIHWINHTQSLHWRAKLEFILCGSFFFEKNNNTANDIFLHKWHCFFSEQRQPFRRIYDTNKNDITFSWKTV